MLEEGRIQVASMVEMVVSLIDKYQYVDIQTTSGRSVDQSGDQGVRLVQAQNQTTVVEADEWLSSVVDVADEADVTDVTDENDDENVTLTMMTKEDKMGWKVVELEMV